MAEGRVQRRLAAILAADVVGYSRLMERDETGTLARLKSLRSEVFDPGTAKYDGRIFKTTGDGALAEFASAVDAVQSAVEIQRALAERNANLPEEERITLRIGISLGDVIVDGDDLYGNGVNIAARMEGLAPPGGICVSGNVQEHLGNTLDVGFEDLGDQSVKNLDRPVRSYLVHLDRDAGTRAPDQNKASDKTSIAVLPFDNLSGDPEQEYFSDGMAEDLITDLSKIPGLAVAARNSSFSFKGQMPNVKEVADALGVAYVLEGSVRKMAARLRINAQLIDAADGTHLWAERYDGEMAEIFDFQDRIREEIVAALELTLTPGYGARGRRRRTTSVEAYDLYLKGRTRYFGYSPDDNRKAGELFEKAIDTDPGFAEARTYLAMCHVNAWLFLWPGFEQGLARAVELTASAVSIDPDSAITHLRHGWVELFRRNYDAAKASIEHAMSLDPDNAEVKAYYAETLNFCGEYEPALEHGSAVFRLDPLSPPSWLFIHGRSHFHLRNYDKAVELIGQAVDRVPDLLIARLFLACAHVELGQLDDAKSQIHCVIEAAPGYSIEVVDRVLPFRLDSDRRRILETLRRAGMPDVAPSGSTDTRPALPDKPSIAVLPFENMSGDPEQEYFSDGITEDLITDISKISGLFVIARNSAFTYKGKTVDVKKVGQDLGVRYVLEGSVRKSGSRVRVTGQLVDAVSGAHIWADRFDRDLTDIFEVQDEIAAQIISALKIKLTPEQKDRLGRKNPIDVEAYNHFLRGREQALIQTKSNNIEARALLERAIEIDPNFAAAHAFVALTNLNDYINAWSETPRRSLETCLDIAKHAVGIDDEDPYGHFIYAEVLLWHREHKLALSEVERCLALAPSSAEGHLVKANIQYYMGNPAEAVDTLDAYMLLDPFYPEVALYFMAQSQEALGHFDEAVKILKRRLERNPNSPTTYMVLASCYGHLDRIAESRAAWEELVRIDPNFSIEWRRHILPHMNPGAFERRLEGMRKAGLPV